MSNIPPINETGRLAQSSPRRAASGAEKAPEAAPADRVEISETGQLLSTLDSRSDIRAQKVAEIRQEIANGTYETEDKIEVAVDRLLELFRGASQPA